MTLWVVTLSGSGDPLSRPDAVANRPEARWERIMQTLKDSPRLSLSGRIVEVDESLRLAPDDEAGVGTALRDLHASDLVDFISGAHSDWVAHGSDCDFANDQSYLVPYHFSTALSTGPCRGALYRNVGFYCTDRTTPLGVNTAHMARLSAACALRAAELLLTATARAVYACTLHPGHHVGIRHYGGYCYHNNAALAAERLRSRFDMVAVVDVDYHHGNGTQQIFYGRCDVFTASLHVTPDVDYPFYSGYASETGADEGLGFNLNVPLPPKTTITEYLQALQDVLMSVKSKGCKVLVVAFGADALNGDPDANPNAGLALEVTDYEAIGRAFAELNLPTLITQEGGYVMESVAGAVEAFLSGFVPRP